MKKCKNYFNKITSLDEETLLLAQAFKKSLIILSIGISAGLFLGVIFAVIKYTPLLIDKL